MIGIFISCARCGFTKGSLRKALDLSIIFFRVFYLTRNTSLPGNMLLDAEHYVKNKFFHDLFFNKDGHTPLPPLSSLVNVYRKENQEKD